MFGESFESSFADKEEHYVVGPANLIRITITTTYVPLLYVSIEDLLDTGEVSEEQTVRRWKYRSGSCHRCYSDRHEAFAEAKRLWEMERVLYEVNKAKEKGESQK